MGHTANDFIFSQKNLHACKYSGSIFIEKNWAAFAFLECPYPLLYRNVKKGHLYARWAYIVSLQVRVLTYNYYKPIKIYITMASYEMEMAVEPVNQLKERVSDWDMSYYDEIEDFNCTTSWYSARRGLSFA